METKFNLVIIRIAICLAAYAAIAFGSMTLLRLTGDLVVCLASLAAILIAAVLAIDYFGKKLGNTQ
jgi:hypothetical protein